MFKPDFRLVLFCLMLPAIAWAQSEATVQSAYQLLVLGTAQDGGYPQADCNKACCQAVADGSVRGSWITSLAIIHPESKSYWLVDCSPDLKDQIQLVKQTMKAKEGTLRGIFLTHAHIGHYLGLAQLGREVMGLNEVPVYAMPRMARFLKENGPWSQLVELKQVDIQLMQSDTPYEIAEGISLTPFAVPHRDEFSETVGYRISGPQQTALFIPDIDKWHRWDKDIASEIGTTDRAYLDATFFSTAELPGRNMEEIPHPFMEESIELLNELSPADKAKVRFIHLNHSNPALRDGKQRKFVEEAGFGIARQGELFGL